MASCHSQIMNFEFTRQEIEEAVRNGRLLTVEIEFSLMCNFSCSYCYVQSKDALKNEMTIDEIQDVIVQAKELGARKIIVLGGEPMIYPDIIKMLKYIKDQGLAIEMFTNGCNINRENAAFLFNAGVHVVLKMNTFDENLQDSIAGKKGAFKTIQTALENLKEAGYPDPKAPLGVSTVVCRQNINEIENMWRWLRERNIIPYFETITPQGNARENDSLDIDPREAFSIFSRISEIDSTEYGYNWTPQPPLIGNKCLRNRFSCLITSKGDVMPCVGVTIPIGNIRQQRLKEIIQDSEVLADLRDHETNIKGPCSECENISDCYGCRGAAYQLTGDYMASDPLCWKNSDRLDEITHLPLAVDSLMPQKSPMKVIDTLEKVSEREGEVHVTIRDDMPFIKPDHTVDESIYMEMIAQSVAAREGFKLLGTGTTLEGFLLGARALEIYSTAQVGDRLRIAVKKQARYGDFGIVHGFIYRGDEMIAQGEIKIWQKNS